MISALTCRANVVAGERNAPVNERLHALVDDGAVPLVAGRVNLREIRLVPQQEIRSRLISGTLKSSEFTTRVVDNGSEVHILNSGRFVPEVWVPPVIGPAVIAAETRKQFDEIRAEILRRNSR